ncbi:MAG: hypothetical protein KJ645_02760 [Planctomycetes bacterium]|nr:hypothetical protein [Planctomycetota bacterium]
MNNRFNPLFPLLIMLLILTIAPIGQGTDPVNVISYKIEATINEEGISELVVLTAEALNRVQTLQLELADTMKVPIMKVSTTP